jgi:hypothetical protein
MTEAIESLQKEICRKHGAAYHPAPSAFKVGIALNVRGGLMPLNGLRHPVENNATGWYIWAGEQLSTDPDFFKSLHVAHLNDWCPAVQKYLGLPPGWRFLIAGDHEDVWYDQSLLAT